MATDLSSVQYVFIGIGITVGVVGLALLIVTFVGTAKKDVSPALTTPFFILIYFLPYIVSFYTIFNDVLTKSFTLSASLISAFVVISINRIISGYHSGINPFARNDVCSIPGMSGLFSTTIPQSPLFVSTIFGHIIMYLVVNGSTSEATNATIMWVLTSLLQYTTFSANPGCFEAFRGIWSNYDQVTKIVTPGFFSGKLSPIASIVIGVSLGFVSGGATALIIKKFFTPGTVTPSPLIGPGGIQRCPDGRPPGPNGECGVYPTPSLEGPTSGSSSSSGVGTCSPPNDQDQFVCETYKDGKLVTSTIASS